MTPLHPTPPRFVRRHKRPNLSNYTKRLALLGQEQTTAHADCREQSLVPRLPKNVVFRESKGPASCRGYVRGREVKGGRQQTGDGRESPHPTPLRQKGGYSR